MPGGLERGASLLTEHAGTIVLAHLLLGSLVLSILEAWSPVDALYFCVTTLTTVGYGDLAPKSSLGRLFTSLHIFVGASLVASCLGTLVGRMQARFMEREAAIGAGKAASLGGGNRELNELIKAVGAAGAIVATGVVYASVIEGWSFVDSVYWASVSCSSVGLGDLVPHPIFRPLAALYLLPAVGAFAASVGRVARFTAALEMARWREAFLERGVTSELLEHLDSEGSGRIGRAAFVRYMLVATAQVEESELQKLDALFDALDADGSGSLDAADIREHAAASSGGAPSGRRGPYMEVHNHSSSGPESPSSTPRGGAGGFVSSFELQGQQSEDSEAGIEDPGATLLARKPPLGSRIAVRRA